MTVVSWNRASASSPGKHGAKDWRVAFNGSAPEHSEIVFMLGMLLLAEDRYDQPNHDGRYRLWYFIDRLLLARSPEKVLALAQDVQESIADPASVKKVRVA